MPHLNQLVEKYEKKGFSAVGITSEPEDPTMKFVEETGMKAAVVIQTSNATFREYGFSGYPSAALVAPNGKVVWTGHPAELTEEAIESNLAGVKLGAGNRGLTLDVDLPDKLAAVGRKLSGGKLGEGWRALRTAAEKPGLGDGDRQRIEKALAALEALATERMAAAEAAAEAGRYFDAVESFKEVATAFQGEGAAANAQARADAIGRDPALKPEIEAGRRIADALKDAEAGRAKKAMDALKDVAGGRLGQTAEAGRARKLLEEMQGGN